MKKLLLFFTLFSAITAFAQSDGSVSTIRSRATSPGTCSVTAGVIYWDNAGLHFSGCAGPNTVGHVPWLDQPNAFTGGLQDFSAAKLKPPLTTVAALPTASSFTNDIFIVTDGTSSSDCSAGGGSTRSLCVSNGASWVALGGGGGSGSNNGGVNSQTISYTLVAGDSGKSVIFNGVSLTATLPNPPPSAGWTATIFNLNSTSLTISRNTVNINGAASNVTLPQYQAVSIWTDGTNYFTDSVPLLAGTGITFTPTSNSLTIGLTVPVAIGSGGTGQTSAAAAISALMPAPTRAGDVAVWNGSNWVTLAGNNSGTNFLQENASGVPTWAAGSSSIAWSAISAPSSSLTLAMAANLSTFNTTSAITNFFEWANITAATVSAAQSSPTISLCGQGWEGATPANTQDCFQLQTVIGNGANPAVTLTITNSGSSTGQKSLAVPSLQTNGTAQGLVALTASTTLQPSYPANSFGFLAPNSATIATSFFFQPATSTGPAATGPLLVGAVSSNISSMTYGTLSGNTTKVVTTTGTLTSGNVSSWDANGNIIDAGFLAANVTQNSVTGTTNAIPKFSGTHTITNSTISDNGTIVSMTEPLDLTSQSLVSEISNNGTTAPVVNKFVKLTGAPATATVAASSSDNVIGICIGNCTTTGNAQVSISGTVSCAFDNATTAGHYVQISSVGGCHDAGAAYPTSGGAIKGRVLVTNASPGNDNIFLFETEIQAASAGSGYTTILSNGSAITSRNNVNFISGSNATVACVDNGASLRSDCTISASSSAGSRLDQISAATATNTINNADFAQIWNWSLTTASNSGLTFGENVASTATGGILININTLAGSTAIPLQITSRGTANGVAMGAANGVLGQIGTGGFGIGATSHGIVLSEGISTAAVSTSAGVTNQVFKSAGSGADGGFGDLRDVKIIPAANCSNATPGAGWDIPATNAPSPTCAAALATAHTNNLGGVLSWANNNSATNAQFSFELPADWDTGIQPFISIYYGSGANSSGTVKWTFSTACSKKDGSVTDDPAFVAESTTTGNTMAVINRMWAETFQFTTLTSGNNCVAGSNVILKVTSGNGTATSTVNVSKIVLSIPTLPNTAQAN
jgi:hypothetical protein